MRLYVQTWLPLLSISLTAAMLWRRVIRYGTGKTSYWRLLTLSLLKTSSGARDEVLGRHTAVGIHNGFGAFP